MSQLVSCVIALDRLRAIRMPLNYRNSNHKRFAYLIGGITAAYSVSALFVNAFVQGDLMVNFKLIFFISYPFL
jgi:hypothetical protein